MSYQDCAENLAREHSMNYFSRTILRIQGHNPDEIEKVLSDSKKERERMRRERKRVEREIMENADRAAIDVIARRGRDGR